jgi:Glycosyltransferases, probably involved in cell wall biogenesis
MEHLSFSVSMCLYWKDDPQYFETAILSIMNQSIIPSEIILVVDGPIPNQLKNVIDKYRNNSLLKIIELKENLGHGKARNIGLKNCSNDIIALMDSDDISVPTRFEKQLNIFNENPEISIIGGNIYEFIDDPNNIIGCRNVPSLDSDIKSYMKKRCPFNQMSVMFKKCDVENAGGYLDWYHNEDYYLWIRMALLNYKFYNISENLVYVRVGKEMYSRRGGRKYFVSEVKLQNYMLKHKVISFPTYISNVIKRLIIQIILPNSIRGFIFKKFARRAVK